MPVILTLTDEQALDIVSQVSGLLRTKGVGGSSISLGSSQKEVSAYGKLLAAINEMPKGKLFSPRLLAGELGLTPNYVSGTLRVIAKKAGSVAMAQRGTWKKET